MRAPIIGLLVAAVLVGLVACRAAFPDPCELLTTADLEAELGVSFTEPGPAAGTIGTYGGTCFWSSRDAQVVAQLGTDPWHDPQDPRNWQWSRERLGYETVPDVGDEAIGLFGDEGGWLYVHQGEIKVTLRVGGEDYSGSAAETKSVLISLARLALAKL